MSSLQERQNELVNEFLKIQDWEDRYKKIIDLSKTLPPLEESKKTELNLVKGCQSQVWLVAELTPEGKILLKGDSDAVLVKGLVAVVLRIYSNSFPEEILNTPPTFLKDLGFEGNLSPNRANGLHTMLKQIRLFATAFSLLKR